MPVEIVPGASAGMYRSGTDFSNSDTF